MKHYLKCLFFILLCCISPVFGQAPEIEWQKAIGGSNTDNLYYIEQTSDNGYILGGASSSILSGDKTETSQGEYDYWVIKLDSLGNIQWQNTIGGNMDDWLYSISETPDSCYMLCGTSKSGISGDKTDPNFGGKDIWIIKLNYEGDLIWQKTIGGNVDDGGIFMDIILTSQGFLIGTFSYSGISGNKTEANLGSADYWVIKIDNDGNILWQNSIGGSATDALYSIDRTVDGGYILGGTSLSGISGDKTEPSIMGGFGNTNDYWVIKLDSLGNIQWQNTIGGSSGDGLKSIKQTFDGGYILGGGSASDISGDKTEGILGMAGTSDYWIIKLDSLGSIEWQNTIGGSSFEEATSVNQTIDGGFIIGGISSSGISGDKTEINFGGEDYWVLKLDSSGSIEWQMGYGGSEYDNLYELNFTVDLGYIIGGWSTSGISGNKNVASNGDADYWVIKLFTDIDCIASPYYLDADEDGFGDILFEIMSCELPIGYVTNPLDCDDLNELIFPTAEDVCNTFDDNCNGIIDEDATFTNWYLDFDTDGFGDILVDSLSCFDLTGYVIDNTDCNDLNPEINPTAIEICNSLDDDCNFIIDDWLPVYDYYYDGDEDGYGDILIEITTCNDIPPTGFVIDNTDCDDTEDLIHEPLLYYADTDGDLYGDELNSDFFCTIFPPTGYAINNLDCNDSNNLINPLSNETCNNIDDNCNSEIDEGFPAQTLFIDADADNFGNYLIDTITCFFEIAGYVPDNTDCDDTNPLVYPDAPEILDGLDNDCNQVIDEGVGIDGLEDETVISIYPNPANDILNIEYSGAELISFEILNVVGEKVLTGEINNSHFVIDISKVAGGVYFFRVTNVVLEFEFEFVKE